MRQHFFLQLCFLLLPIAIWTQNRDCDVVTLKGSDANCMTSVAANTIVGFAYNSGTWTQIPIQVDEMVWKDIETPYGANTCLGSSILNIPWNHLFYADSITDVGNDPNTLFDVDDELSFMAKDAGDRFISGNCPQQIFESSLCEIEVVDPLTAATLGFIYLFEQSGGLDPGAGQNYVTYAFGYASNYNQYNVCVGSNNNEISSVTTANYEMEFHGRWIEDVLRIHAGGASGVDILDRHQAFIFPNNCTRNENTFTAANGPVVNAIDGPVRAIRSVMGANSGTFNQIVITFSECRIDYTLHFRVHPVGGFYDVLDFSPNAIGMNYYSDQLQGGVVIDGNPDNVPTVTPNAWEMITGNQGTIIVGYDYETDMSIGTVAQAAAGSVEGGVESYYDDAGVNAAHTCTGDGLSFGSSGFHLATFQCTDRRYPQQACGPSAAKFFTLHRHQYLLEPNLIPDFAERYYQQLVSPLYVQSQLLASACTSGNTLSVQIVSQGNVLCNGGNTGMASASASGGTGNYTYQWSNGGTGTTITGLTAGTYTVTVNDGIGTAVVSVIISEPPPLIVSVTGTNASGGASNGTATASPSGGSPGYTNAWSTGTTGSVITGLAPGLYTVTVTDDNACTTSGSVTILDDPKNDDPPPGGGDFVDANVQNVLSDYAGPGSQIHKDVRMQVALYPMGTRHAVTLRLEATEHTLGKFRVLDTYGRLIGEKRIRVQPGYFEHNIEIDGMISGIYIAQLILSDQRIFTEKILVAQ